MDADELRRERGLPQAVHLAANGEVVVEPMTWEQRDALVAPDEED